MYNEKKNNITVWVFAAVIVVLALLVVFYKSRPAETTEKSAEQKTAETSTEQPKPAGQKPVEQPKPAVETSPKPSTSPKPAETSHDDEHRKNAEMRENEETVGDAIPESNPAEQKESEDLESVEISEGVDVEVVKDKDSTADSEGFLHGKILPKKGIEEALLKVPGLQLKHAMEISNAIRYDVDLTQIKAGEDFKVKFDKDGNVEEFVYYPDIVTFHILKRDPVEKKLKYTAKNLPTERRFRIIEGKIDSTLNESLVKRDDVTRNIRAVTVGILECIVSFSTDARKGDEYRILVEDRYYKGEMVPGSKVLYASYRGKQAGFSEAFRYEDEEPKSAFNAHYTDKGKALIPSAMRLPLDTIRITSPFGMRRHPITGKMTQHHGVDYGAPVGTPVYAVAPGKVIEVKQTPLGGKQVTINHADNTKTYYLHLNSYNVSVGTAVSARQRIASVGNTGRSTGPHLHLGIKSPKGDWLNPQKVKMIATPQLDNKRMPRFKTQMKEILALLENTEKYQEWMRKYDEGPQPGDFYQQYKE
ncbi:peptidoglycan DD-metalloendopeptidase family protein [bacterium]|nr:peptidoglycan DD-metalloendopeptidase family protein [bacterium]